MHYFAAVDFTHQDRTAPITTPLVPAGTTIVGRYRQALVDGRVDHKVNDRHSLMIRGNLDRFYDTNPQDAVSGNVLPSAGRRFTRHAYGGQINEISILSSTMLNEARFEYQNADPVTAFDPLAGPAIPQNGAASWRCPPLWTPPPRPPGLLVRRPASPPSPALRSPPRQWR